MQIQVLLLLRQLQRQLGMAMVFVTHDMGVAAEISDRVAVMYAGRFVEAGTARQIIRDPRHPYTAGLLHSTAHSGRRGGSLDAIPGTPPDLAHATPGLRVRAALSLGGRELLHGPSASGRPRNRRSRSVRARGRDRLRRRSDCARDAYPGLAADWPEDANEGPAADHQGRWPAHRRGPP